MSGIKNITHTSFRCHDFEKMVSFYRDTLELEFMFTLRHQNGNPWLTYLKVAPGEFIELFNEQYSDNDPWENQGHHHICLIVENIEEAAETLEAKGVKLTHGPAAGKSPFRRPFLVEEAPLRCHSRAFYIQDPEGNEIEVMQYTEKSLQVICDK